MISLGEIKCGKELGIKTYHYYIWRACIDCGKERWVRLVKGKPRSERCQPCNNIQTSIKRKQSSKTWGTGKTYSYGYVVAKVEKDDFFYSMAKKGGFILEHRLIMARHLCRCLLPWEIVHHKNNIRDDNRIENLQLVSSQKVHIIDIYTKSLLKRLTLKIAELEKENIRLKLLR